MMSNSPPEQMAHGGGVIRGTEEHRIKSQSDLDSRASHKLCAFR